MYYNAQQYSKKVQKRIMRHKRVRYHNDAVLFTEDTYSYTRKRTNALRKSLGAYTDDNDNAV